MVSRALLLVIFSACLLAQSQGERPAFRSGVDVVQIDVSVLDGKRRPVRGLTTTDFTVLEDGKPREIVAFTPVDLPARTTAPAVGSAAWTREVAPDVATNDVPAEGRLVVIVFDWSIRFDDSTLARKIARATVNDLGPGDEAAIVFTSEFANAGIPQNFTSNRSLLLRTIDEPMAFAMKGNDSISPKAGGFINANSQLIMDPYGYGSGGCLCRVCTLDAMTRVADALRGASGRRKVMIFIGTLFRGFEAAMVPPREAMRGLPPPPATTIRVRPGQLLAAAQGGARADVASRRARQHDDSCGRSRRPRDVDEQPARRGITRHDPGAAGEPASTRGHDGRSHGAQYECTRDRGAGDSRREPVLLSARLLRE
jgi:VWFA-related protein